MSWSADKAFTTGLDGLGHFVPLKSIVSEPALLRQMVHADVGRLYEIYLSAPQMLHCSKIFAPDWLHGVVDDDSQVRRALLNVDGSVIGGATLWPSISEYPGTYSPTIWVDPSMRGRGIATSALRILLESTPADCQRIKAGVYAYNGPSIRLAYRAFGPHVRIEREGEWNAQLIFEKLLS